jgi:hypothetical protein
VAVFRHKDRITTLLRHNFISLSDINISLEHVFFMVCHVTTAMTLFRLFMIAQSVLRLATGWATEGSEFESQLGQEFSFFLVVHTGSGVHPISYPIRNWGSFPEGKAAEACS